MTIEEHQSKEEIRASYDSCNTKKTPLLEEYNSISFGETDADGNIIVFHIFYLQI